MLLKQSSLARGDASGIRFDRPFCQCREIEQGTKAFEQTFNLRSCESGWRAATEVNCRWKEMSILGVVLKFAQHRFTEALGLRSIEQLFVKRAVRTNARAERDVQIEVSNRSGRRF